jgi:hypothetical protein
MKGGKMFKLYKVAMEFENRVCGSVPLSKELVPIWLKSRMPKNKSDNDRPVEEIEQEVLDSIQETEERTTLGFQDQDGVLVVRGGTIKAHLKDCANQVKDALKPQIKAFRAKVANKVYVDEYWIPIMRRDEFVTEPDGSFEQPVHVMTAMGPRNALKQIQYVEKPVLSFTLKLLPDKEVTADALRSVFEYGSVHGYGGERGMGEGRYRFTMEEAD